MKIGFIGYNKHTGRIIDKIQNDNKLSLTGIYSSHDISLKNNSLTIHTPEKLMDESDILYISDSEGSYDICQYAIKESRHLFFESPFCLTLEEFERLFHLANETNSHIKFSQEILQKQIYTALRKSLNPVIIKFNIFDNKENELKNHIFNFVTITRELVKSGIKKIYYNKTSNDFDTALSFNLNLIFDNGRTAECFVTQITDVEKVMLQAYQESEAIEIDFKNNYATIASWKGETIEKNEFKRTDNKEKTIEDLIQFAENISTNNQKPLIVREESYYILTVTHKLLDTIHSTVKT
ncbi:MAG: Gfo/Idh/MocA family oxidoreductase [Bacteroidales bacterium]